MLFRKFFDHDMLGFESGCEGRCGSAAARIGNLALVSRSINSEYSNLPYNEKRQRFLNKRALEKRSDSLKMDLIYSSNEWGDARAAEHQAAMQATMQRHYQRRFAVE